MPRRALPLVCLLVLFLLGQAQAQSAQIYWQQCQSFEAAGDLQTARQSCLTALQLDPNLADAVVALARIEIGLGDYISAERRLSAPLPNRLRAEAALLLAELRLEQGRPGEAARHLNDAGGFIDAQATPALAARQRFLRGQLAEQQGQFEEALSLYGQAASLAAADARYFVAEASLRLRLGDPIGSQQTLLSYSGPVNADVLALIGRAQWAEGNLSGAAQYLERAIQNRNPRESDARARDRRDLVLVYFGQGNWTLGELTLRSALERDDFAGMLVSLLLPWLLAFVALLGLHLLGESKIGASSTLEVVSKPEPWTVGQVYLVLVAALALAAFVSVLYGTLVYGNWLAILTPLQGGVLRALYLAVLALLLALLAYYQLRRLGWRPESILLGKTSFVTTGVGVGLALLALVLLYQAFMPRLAWLQGFYLDLSRVNPWLVLAALLLPLGEPFFRPFAMTAFTRRYGDARLAAVIAALLFALLVGFPLPLAFLIGIALSESYRRSGSGVLPLTALMTLHLGLLIAVLVSPWARGLFV